MTGGPKCIPFTVPPLVFSSLKATSRWPDQEENPFGDEASTSPKKTFPALESGGFKSTGDYTAFDNGVENRDTLTPKATGGTLSRCHLGQPRWHAIVAYSRKGSVTAVINFDELCEEWTAYEVLYEIANAAQQMSNAAWDNTGSVPFFVEILSKYLYFFEKGNPQITGAAIQSLIELITTEMQSDNSTPDPAADDFLSRTLGYIQFQKQKGGANGEKYDPIKV
ncbi:hypothetical protein POTOM_028287 [Populus tomentosa]|uniref:Uncharacterized protein n=1 Tax=Populus tomentosa TaxID=118781 RepID=A0A8X7Z8S1_POPTO|nr:hypothetical protein POTOM_028287 [Populus tomentosa]